MKKQAAGIVGGLYVYEWSKLPNSTLTLLKSVVFFKISILKSFIFLYLKVIKRIFVFLFSHYGWRNVKWDLVGEWISEFF